MSVVQWKADDNTSHSYYKNGMRIAIGSYDMNEYILIYKDVTHAFANAMSAYSWLNRSEQAQPPKEILSVEDYVERFGPI